MTKMSPEEIIEGQLNAGEKLLWSHVISYDESKPITALKTEQWKTILKWLYRFFMMLVVLNVVFIAWSMQREELIKLLKGQLPILVFLIFMMWFLEKTKLLQKLEETTTHGIYGSCIITDSRVVLFNHNASEREEFSSIDIADVHMDFDNGGRALRFKPNNQDNDSILIGIVDFQAALAILQSRFLNPISTT